MSRLHLRPAWCWAHFLAGSCAGSGGRHACSWEALISSCGAAQLVEHVTRKPRRDRLDHPPTRLSRRSASDAAVGVRRRRGVLDTLAGVVNQANVKPSADSDSTQSATYERASS